MTSYIYFIQAEPDGPIKIGTTTANPHFRMKNLQTGCPWTVKLLGAIEGSASQEKQIHAVLSYFRTQGEWFSPHPTVLSAIEAALTSGKAAKPFALRKNTKFDNHVSRVIVALGGTGEVAKLIGGSPAVVSNWKKSGAFPPKTYITIQTALAQRNLSAPNSLWGMSEGGIA